MMIYLLLMLIWSSSTCAHLEAYIDRSSVTLDEIFTLTLEMDGDVNSEPNSSALTTDFEVRAVNHSNAIALIKDKLQKKSYWYFTLIAKRAGQLFIPSFYINGEQSQPLEITVNDASPVLVTQTTKQRALFIEVSAEPRIIYLQQQVIFIVRFFRTMEIAPVGNLSEPLVNKNLFVARLSENDYRLNRDGQQYIVFERRYALYPQQVGVFTINPIIFDSNPNEQRRRPNNLSLFDYPSQNNQQYQLQSAAIELTVKPIPKRFAKQSWLPARNLQLTDYWSPNPPQFIVGKPVTRTITLIADGVSAEKLPKLTQIMPNEIKQSQDPPMIIDNRDDNGITGTRQEKITFIPDQAGYLNFPPLAIHWWNTINDSYEIARLSNYAFEILPASSPSPTPSPELRSAKIMPSPTVNHLPLPVEQKQNNDHNEWHWLIILIFALGWAGTAILWWRQHVKLNSNQLK